MTGDRHAALIDHVGGTRDQSDTFVGREGPQMGRQVTRFHHIVLVEDGDHRRPAQRNAKVPVTRQAQALRVHRDPGAIPGNRANHIEGRVV